MTQDRSPAGLTPILVAVPVIAIAVAVIWGLATGWPAALRLWTALAVTLAAIPAGALGLLLLHLLTGWELADTGILRRLARTLPVVLPLLAPALIWPEHVLVWAGDGLELESPVSSALLVPWAFALRTFIIVALLSWMAWRPHRGFLVLYLPLVALAGADWVLSLQPQTTSAGFAFIYAAHLLAMAVGTTALLASSYDPDPPGRMARAALVGAGLLWAYLAYLDHLTVWSSNLPSHIGWYLVRSDAAGTLLRGAAYGLTALGLLAALAAGRSRVGYRIAGGLVLSGQLAEAGWQLLPMVQGPPSA